MQFSRKDKEEPKPIQQPQPQVPNQDVELLKRQMNQVVAAINDLGKKFNESQKKEVYKFPDQTNLIMENSDYLDDNRKNYVKSGKRNNLINTGIAVGVGLLIAGLIFISIYLGFIKSTFDVPAYSRYIQQNYRLWQYPDEGSRLCIQSLAPDLIREMYPDDKDNMTITNFQFYQSWEYSDNISVIRFSCDITFDNITRTENFMAHVSHNNNVYSLDSIIIKNDTPIMQYGSIDSSLFRLVGNTYDDESATYATAYSNINKFFSAWYNNALYDETYANITNYTTLDRCGRTYISIENLVLTDTVNSMGFNCCVTIKFDISGHKEIVNIYLYYNLSTNKIEKMW